MPVYLCRWPDGNLAIVTAFDLEEAILRLDEFGNPDQAELREIDDLVVNLELTDHGDLRVAQWGDTSREDVFAWAYPQLDAALTQEAWDEDGADLDPSTVDNSIPNAVERERTRFEGRQDRPGGAKPKSEMGRQIQAAIGAPAALADQLAEEVGTRILEDAEIEGPEN